MNCSRVVSTPGAILSRPLEMSGYNIITCKDAAALAESAGERFVQWSRATSPYPSRIRRVALSGGRVARHFLSELAARHHASNELLAGVHFFWADERCVPAHDSESNYRLARESLFDPARIAPTFIHRIPGELTPSVAAACAEDEFRALSQPGQSSNPVFDLVILGMGEDGHVASLFPGTSPGQEAIDRIYVAVRGPKPPPDRVSLTYAALFAAEEVWVLVAGAGKAAVLEDSLSPSGATPLAQVVRHRRQTSIWSCE